MFTIRTQIRIWQLKAARFGKIRIFTLYAGEKLLYNRENKEEAS